MRVEIDEAGDDVQTAGIDHLFRLMRLEIADGGDLTVLDGDVGPIARQTRAVDHHSTLDDDIEFRHLVFLPRFDCEDRFVPGSAQTTFSCAWGCRLSPGSAGGGA